MKQQGDDWWSCLLTVAETLQVKRIYIRLPSKETREEMIAKLIKTQKHDLTARQISSIAKATEGINLLDQLFNLSRLFWFGSHSTVQRRCIWPNQRTWVCCSRCPTVQSSTDNCERLPELAPTNSSICLAWEFASVRRMEQTIWEFRLNPTW
jgi:hypothetical protein